MRPTKLPISITLAAISALLLGALAAPAPAGDEAGMAPGDAPAPAVEALLPQLLRTDISQPYAMAAIKLGPEFWTALEADLGRAQDNMLRTFFGGGLLFGVGPWRNVLGATPKGRAAEDAAVVRWTAPPTMRAVLVLQLDDPEVEVTIEGQPVQLLKRGIAERDPHNLLNQLEFIYFPLTVGGNADPILAELATRMTLTITGIAPGAVHRFSWQLRPPRSDYPPGQLPIVVQQQRGPNRLADGPRPRMEEMGMAPGAPGGGYAMGLGGGGLGGGLVGAMGPAEEGPAAPAVEPAAGGEPRVRTYATDEVHRYPMSRAASNVGAEYAVNQVLAQEEPLVEAYAGVEQVARTNGNVTVDLWTSPIGRQEVDLVDRAGHTVDRLKSGPAPASGRALASWKPGKGDAEQEEREFAFVVRNSVATPHGAQISEATVPLPPMEQQAEPTGALAPPLPTVTDIAVTELSVAGEMLQVRARVASVMGPQGPVAPEVQIALTTEAGEPVKTLTPMAPAPGKDYVFAWDSTGEDGQPVPPGRYVLRIGALMESEQGKARSELRYWIDVPLDKTQRRMAVLGPAALQTLQAQIVSEQPGQTMLAYVAPKDGHLRAFVVDDITGRVVSHLADMQVTKGGGKVMWDGTDDAGQPVPDGSYTVQFELDAGQAGGWWGVVPLDAPPQQ